MDWHNKISKAHKILLALGSGWHHEMCAKCLFTQQPGCGHQGAFSLAGPPGPLMEDRAEPCCVTDGSARCYRPGWRPGVGGRSPVGLLLVSEEDP